MTKRRGRGEGSIYQKPDGTWIGQVSVVNGAGKRKRRAVTGETKPEVIEKLRRLQDQAAGGFLDTDRLTVGDYLDEWLRAIKGAVEPNTWIYYEKYVRKYLKPQLGRHLLSKLTALAIEAAFPDLTKEGVSPLGIRNAVKTLAVALARAVRLKLIPFSPTKAVVKPKAQKVERAVWTAEETLAFLKAAEGDRLEALYWVAIDGGLRQGELFGLQWGDFNFKKGTVTIVRSLEEVSRKKRKEMGSGDEEASRFRLKTTKTPKSRRTLTLTPQTMAKVEAHRAKMLAEGNIAGPVFCDGQGGFLTKSNVRKRSFLPTVEKAGVRPIRPVDLRHMSATLLLAAGEDVKTISSRLGHSTITLTLDTYSHVLETSQQRAADTMARVLGGNAIGNQKATGGGS